MNNIELIETLRFRGEVDSSKDKDVRRLFSGARRHIMEVALSNNAVLSKHTAAEPITVLCLAGTGTFFAGDDLQDEQPLEPGTFITLEANVSHQVVAEPELRVLVTKFKED